LERLSEMTSLLGGSGPPKVAVVVNEAPSRINALLDSQVVDVVQLSGDERPSVIDLLAGPVWKTLRFPAGTARDEALREVSQWLDRSSPVQRVLIDAAVAGAYGGTGHRADWTLAAGIAERYPVVLAGGLNPVNVGDAIGSVMPGGVDVSSGVERDGRKDHDRIRSFVKQAQAAFDHVEVSRRA